MHSSIFYNKETYSIQAKDFKKNNKGILKTYRIGEKIPINCIGLSSKELQHFGECYNIFPYKSEDYVLLIRDGVFMDAVHYTELKDDYVFPFKCFDICGTKLNIGSVKEYINLKESI